MPWGGVRAQDSASSGLRLDAPGEGCTEGSTGLGSTVLQRPHTGWGAAWAGQCQGLELSFLYQKTATFSIR